MRRRATFIHQTKKKITVNNQTIFSGYPILRKNSCLKPPLILIKDLVRVLQNRVNNLDLPPGIGNGGSRIGAHEGRPEDDGQVVGVHAVRVRVVHDAVEVEGEGAECGVVGIGKAIDNSVEGIPTNHIIFMLCGCIVSLNTGETREGRWHLLAAAMKLSWCS